ncbi:MAG: DsbA family protein [Pseudomonadota bacterium]
MTTSAEELLVLFDFRDPHSYLALNPTRALIERTGVVSHWIPFLGKTLRAPTAPEPGADRGTLHRWHRASYAERDLIRYAAAQGLPAQHFEDGGLYRQGNGEIAALGFNWAMGEGPAVARNFLTEMFQGYWDGNLDVDKAADVERALALAGADAEGFDVYCAGQGLEEFAAQREEAVAAGGFGPPSFIFAGQVFLGRQHLPRLEALITAELGGAGETA